MKEGKQFLEVEQISEGWTDDPQIHIRQHPEYINNNRNYNSPYLYTLRKTKKKLDRSFQPT